MATQSQAIGLNINGSVHSLERVKMHASPLYNTPELLLKYAACTKKEENGIHEAIKKLADIILQEQYFRAGCELPLLGERFLIAISKRVNGTRKAFPISEEAIGLAAKIIRLILRNHTYVINCIEPLQNKTLSSWVAETEKAIKAIEQAQNQTQELDEMLLLEQKESQKQEQAEQEARNIQRILERNAADVERSNQSGYPSSQIALKLAELVKNPQAKTA